MKGYFENLLHETSEKSFSGPKFYPIFFMSALIVLLFVNSKILYLFQMAMVSAKREIGIKDTTKIANVPDNPKAKLMYYLQCVSCVLDLKDNQHINRLTRYGRYNSLDDDDTDILLTLIILFSPDELIGKVFLPCEDTESTANEFYEINSVSHLLAATSNVVIGGQTRRVLKIMLFKMIWMEIYYFKPLVAFQDRIAGLASRLSGERSRPAITSSPASTSAPRRTSSSNASCCNIL